MKALTFLIAMLLLAEEGRASPGTASAMAARRRNFWEQVIKKEIKAMTPLRGEVPPQAFGVRLNSSALTDAIKKLGKTEMIRTGDAALADAAICYQGKDGTTAGFTSDEMHGGGAIASIEVLSASAQPRFANCARSDQVNQDLATSSGLKLGLKRSVAEKLFGSPSRKERDYSYYRYEIQTEFRSKTEPVETYPCTEGQEILIHFGKRGVDWYALKHFSFC